MGSAAAVSTGPTEPAPTDSGAAPDQTARTGTYELMLIFPATIADEAIAGIREKTVNLVSDHGLKITAQEDLGKRKFAFPINHIRQGFYHVVQFEGPRTGVKALDHDLRLSPDVLRHLLTVRKVRTPEQLKAQAELRERIQAKRMAAEERAVGERHAKQAQQIAVEKPKPEEPTREVSKEELEKKLEEILTDETMGE